MSNNIFSVPQNFININKNFWPELPDYSSSFLVDLTVVDHEYLNVHLITARVLADILKAKPVALINLHSDKDIFNLAQSYGIKEVVFLEDFKVSFLIKLWFSIRATVVWLFSRTKNQLLNIKYKKNFIGHFVYDTFLISTGLGTVKWWDIRFAKYLRFALILYKKFELVFLKNNFILFFGSEQIYVGSGMSSLAALTHGVKILYRKHGPNRVSYKKYSKVSDLDLFPTHPIEDEFKEVFKNSSEKALEWTDKYITSLFSGRVLDYDWNAKNAYGNANKLSKDEYQKFFDKKYKYHVFIFSHVFVDAVHSYREGLFPDYEIWLRETLKIASKRKDVMWIIKPHPSDSAYKTMSNSITVYKDFIHFENIKLFPSNTLTANLIDDIDAVITMRGTVAGEYSCVGIPVITAGRSMFDEGDFCIIPKNLKEYQNTLLYTDFKRLSHEMVMRAKIYMYVYNNYGRIDMPLLSDLKSAQTIAPTATEIYNHLIFKMQNTEEVELVTQEYKNYIFNKVK